MSDDVASERSPAVSHDGPDLPGGDAADRPVIAVVGAGAVGGLLAALLHRAGAPVVVVARAATRAAIDAGGITIRSAGFGDVHATPATAAAVPPGARVIVATKAAGIEDAAAQLRAAPAVEAISLLNGLEHVVPLRAAAGATPFAGASVAVESLRTGPTEITHRSRGVRVTLPATAGGWSLADELRAAGVEVVVDGTETEVLWRKLRFLAPHALLTSLAGSGIGDGLDADADRTRALVHEIAAVATADGVPTDGAALEAQLRRTPREARSSLQADLAAGRPGELDAIGGAVVRRAAAHGIPVPTLVGVVAELAGRLGG